MRPRLLPILLAAATTFIAQAPSQAAATTYPDHPITLIIPFAPGAMGTLFGAVISEGLAPTLGQHIIVEYRPGAAGSLGAGFVAKAAPDGYTLMMAVNSTMAVNPFLYKSLPYDPLKDFAPIGLVWTSANVLAVNPNSPYHSVKDLIAAAREHPGKITFGSAGQGTTQHLAGEMLREAAHIDIVHVPYKGTAPVMVDLMGGQIDFGFVDSSTLSQITSGKLRAIAVSGSKRMAVLPDVPTVEESGLKGYQMTSWYALMAPAGTPRDVIDKIDHALTVALQNPVLRQRIKDQAAEPVDDDSPAALDKLLRSDMAKWKKFVADTGLKID